MKKIFLSFLVFSLCVSFAHAEFVSDDDFKGADKERYLKISAEIEKNGKNAILCAELEMLAHKTGNQNNNCRYIKSNISKDLSGFSNGSSLDGLDILTGDRAIDEGLQLGSIGEARQDNTQDNVEYAIKQFKYKKGEYPKSLKDFENENEYWASVWINGRNRNVADLADDFSYVLTEDGFTLKHLEAGTESIDEIPVLEIESHDYARMIKDENLSFEIPEIAKISPENDFFVYFSDAEKFLELKKNTEKMTNEFVSIYEFINPVKIEKLVFERLGIPNEENFYALISEFAFVSDDLAFNQKTDFALIVKFKSNSSSLLAGVLENGENKFEKVGDYFVFATNESMLKKIQKTQIGGEKSLASAEDFQYSLGVLDGEKDGMAYLSDAFIRKLTSPTYRINARRKNTILSALETLQYTSWAYKDITGKWAENFDEIAKAGYMQKNAIAEEEKYSIDENGVVHHADWGTVFSPTPVNRVKINEIKVSEKLLYEDFREMYNDYYREFFDPVGISINISDKIAVHTVILPLIENSEYNMVRTLFGTKNPKENSFITNPDRESAVLAAAVFSFDDFLAEGAGSVKKAEDQIKKELKLDLGLAENERIFDFLGDEIAFGIGEKNQFSQNNIANLDLFLGLKLNNPEKANKILEKVFESLSKELGGRRSSYFGISSTKPLRNEYNGKEYFIVPTGFINVFYAFINNRFYVTISQVAMNNIIDGQNRDVAKGEFGRIINFIGNKNNINILAKPELFSSWFPKDLKNELSYEVKGMLKDKVSYLREAGTLYGITKKTYYKNMPETFLNAKFEGRNGKNFFVLNSRNIDINMIDFDSYSENRDKIPMEEILKDLELTKLTKMFDLVKDFGIGFNFTPHGVDIKIAIDNVLTDDGAVVVEEPIKRAPIDYVQPYIEDISLENIMENKVAMLAGAGMLVVLVLLGFAIKK